MYFDGLEGIGIYPSDFTAKMIETALGIATKHIERPDRKWWQFWKRQESYTEWLERSATK